MGNSAVIRCVIFDLDGVIVHTDELHYVSWKRLADAEGIPFDRAANDRLRGVDRAASLEIVLERSRRVYSPAEKAALMDRKNHDYREALSRLGPGDATPGSRELLLQLRSSGIRTAIASSSRNAPLILERLELTHHFNAVADGNDNLRAKPAPDLFVLAASRCGVEPRQCVVIEDAPAGVEAARRAGMFVIGIGDPRILAGANLVAPSLAALSAADLLAAGGDRRQVVEP